jgi:dTDP-4-dehydrorhamnose reductase
MKILVTGANGLLGQVLVKKLCEKNYTVVGTGKGPSRLITAALANYRYEELDITDGPAVEKCIVEERPAIVVHCAAMTQVDECEKNKQECYNVNVTATRFLIDSARLVKARFLFVSTDFVFDGENGPYKEDDVPSPVNYYGSSKLVAEKAVMESGLNWAIARTILVYGEAPTTGRTNIVSWVKKSLESGTPIKMVSDQLRTPTFVHDLANGIILMIEKNAEGIYHISGDEKMTPYQMAVETARFFGLDQSLISESTSDVIKQPALRPPRTGFDISKAKRDLGFRPVSFMEGLRQTFT